MITIKIVTQNPNRYLQENPAFRSDFNVSSTDLGDGTYLITAEAYNDQIDRYSDEVFNGDDTMTSITLEDFTTDDHLFNLHLEDFPSITSITIKDCNLEWMPIYGAWTGDNETASMLDTIKLIGNVSAIESFCYIQRLTNIDITEFTSGDFNSSFNYIPITNFTLNKPMHCSACFQFCPYLTSVNITDGDIEDCFTYNSISSISIGENVGDWQIDYSSFKSNPITSISVDVNNAYYSGEGNCLIRKADNTLILGSSNSVIPSSVVSIGDSAFLRNSALTHITIPGSVTNIRENAFSACTNLLSVTFETPSTSHALVIGEYAFSFCSALQSIEIPAHVTEIGDSAFASCYNLYTVICHAINPPQIQEDTFSYHPDYNTLEVPEESLDAYTSNSLYTSSFRTIKAMTPIVVTYSIDVLASPNGTVQAPQTAVEHSDVEVIITPNKGYKIGSLEDNNVNKPVIASGMTYIIKDISTDHNLKVTFVEATEGFNMKGMIDTNYAIQDTKIRF